MENLRKRINVRLVNRTEDFLKYTSKPTYITHKIFGKDYAAIHEIKPVLILNKPICVGFTVLDLSKWWVNRRYIIWCWIVVYWHRQSYLLKSKMYSIKTIDGKEYNTAKGVSIATELNSKMSYLMKK